MKLAWQWNRFLVGVIRYHADNWNIMLGPLAIHIGPMWYEFTGEHQ